MKIELEKKYKRNAFYILLRPRGPRLWSHLWSLSRLGPKAVPSWG